MDENSPQQNRIPLRRPVRTFLKDNMKEWSRKTPDLAKIAEIRNKYEGIKRKVDNVIPKNTTPLRRSIKNQLKTSLQDELPYLETSSGIPIRSIHTRYKDVREKMSEAAARFERRNRVTQSTVILMLMTAGFYDLLQFLFDLIPLIGWLLSSGVGIASWITFYIWTSCKGWGMSDTVKKFIASKVLPAIGCVGLLNIGPEITAGVIFTLLIIKSEDTLYNKTKGNVDFQILQEGAGFLNYLKKLV